MKNTLINVTKDEGTKFHELVTLFMQKIKGSIMDDRPVVISAANSCVSISNRISVEDYEFDMDHFYLNDGNFEMSLKMEDIKEIKYDDTCDETFTFLHNDSTEVLCCFL